MAVFSENEGLCDSIMLDTRQKKKKTYGDALSFSTVIMYNRSWLSG